MPSNKDRLLQIELVKLQLESQFYMTTAFGVLATIVSVLVLFGTLVFTLSSDYALLKSVIICLMAALAIAVIIFTVVLFYRINKVADQIEGLKGQFCN
jgi:hypothetical protein